MKFEVCGTGEINIIFLHGWGAGKSSFYWLKDYISQRLHFASLDGFDGTNAPSDSTIQGYAARLKDYILSNNLSNIILVGHSFGGRIAIEYASCNKVLGLVLVDSAGVKPKFSWLKVLKIIKYKILKMLCKLRIIGYTKLKKYGSIDYQNATDDMKKVFFSAIKYNQKKLLRKINAKTLIVWGKNDLDTPVYMAKTINKNIANSKLVWLDGGHFSFLDDKYSFYNILNYFVEELRGVDYE